MSAANEAGGAARAPVEESGGGSVVEVQLVDGVWRRGKLVGRVAGTQPPMWRVHFDNGELREDIRLANLEAPVRFDASAYGATVEVRVAGAWRRGRLVGLVRGSELWGVAFEDGGWAEDVRLGDPDVRYVFAGRGEAEKVVGAVRVDDAAEDQGQESKKRGRTESGGGDRSGGGAKLGGPATPANEEEKSKAEAEGGHGSKTGGGGGGAWERDKPLKGMRPRSGLLRFPPRRGGAART